MYRRALVLLLTSLFALLPQGRARVTICIADQEVRSDATRPASVQHACCASTACEEPREAVPDGASIDDRTPCDCCLEFDAANAHDPATTPHKLDPGGVDASLPRASFATLAPRHDRPFVLGHERARTERPPPRFALRI